MFLLLRWLTACVALPPDQPKRDYSKKPVAFGVTFAPLPPTQPLKEHNMMPVDECLDEISQCVAIIAIQTSPSVAAQHLREIADEIEDLQQSEN